MELNRESSVGLGRQGLLFIPAMSTDEALARIYSLTGVAKAGRGEKRAIVALRDALGLDLDLERTNSYSARVIAEALDVRWHGERYEIRNKVTLAGLNALLEGATEAFAAGRATRVQGYRPEALGDLKWSEFRPARSKIEAVNRISSLTGSGPEWLGPGSKEHKRVLTNLARHLAPNLSPELSKTKLAEELAREFGAPWTDACVSTGYTISLVGLNTVLAGAELRLGRFQTTAGFGGPAQEGAALVAALVDGLPTGVWDGRTSVRWLERNGTGQQNQTEWPGFYFEARGRQILNAAFTPQLKGPRVQYGHTVFDYALEHVWDLKAHAAERTTETSAVERGLEAMLNDQRAIEACVEEQGLGFLVLNGRAVIDTDGSFAAWHRDFKARQGIRSASSNTGRSRKRKAAFQPLSVDAFWIPNRAALDAAIAGGVVKGAAIGRQAPKAGEKSGATRKPKYNLVFPATELLVASLSWAR
ncbi:hypothetical protein RN607_14260 [Demequina capsici]|uniref:Uncharacterized protein n=1 Tax=Demequina capsici TaxID=3075620 RepID=A0AA96JAU7_9MICO|nr:hypothetical protein [Demequina sp. PMTSA13]WNM27343.1 hypothetical protein RN607_14260 [Demequina sp. PMTSA13]